MCNVPRRTFLHSPIRLVCLAFYIFHSKVISVRHWAWVNEEKMRTASRRAMKEIVHVSSWLWLQLHSVEFKRRKHQAITRMRSIYKRWKLNWAMKCKLNKENRLRVISGVECQVVSYPIWHIESDFGCEKLQIRETFKECDIKFGIGCRWLNWVSLSLSRRLDNSNLSL